RREPEGPSALDGGVQIGADSRGRDARDDENSRVPERVDVLIDLLDRSRLVLREPLAHLDELARQILAGDELGLPGLRLHLDLDSPADRELLPVAPELRLEIFDLLVDLE